MAVDQLVAADGHVMTGVRYQLSLEGGDQAACSSDRGLRVVEDLLLAYEQEGGYGEPAEFVIGERDWKDPQRLRVHPEALAAEVQQFDLEIEEASEVGIVEVLFYVTQRQKPLAKNRVEMRLPSIISVPRGVNWRTLARKLPAGESRATFSSRSGAASA